ncbi:hypothetical protein GCM10020218_075940 [Dactylosporangium vinaceum]
MAGPHVAASDLLERRRQDFGDTWLQAHRAGGAALGGGGAAEAAYGRAAHANAAQLRRVDMIRRMRKIMSVLGVALVLGAAACSDESGDTATGAPSAAVTSAAAVASPSPSAKLVGNGKEICTAAMTMVNTTDVDSFTKQFGALITARQLKNAAAEATAKKAIQDQAARWSQQLNELQGRADDPALRTALGTLASALTKASADDSLAGVKTFEDAGRVVSPVGSAVDALQKACV